MGNSATAIRSRFFAIRRIDHLRVGVPASALRQLCPVCHLVIPSHAREEGDRCAGGEKGAGRYQLRWPLDEDQGAAHFRWARSCLTPSPTTPIRARAARLSR